MAFSRWMRAVPRTIAALHANTKTSVMPFEVSCGPIPWFAEFDALSFGCGLSAEDVLLPRDSISEAERAPSVQNGVSKSALNERGLLSALVQHAPQTEVQGAHPQPRLVEVVVVNVEPGDVKCSAEESKPRRTGTVLVPMT